LVEPAGKVPSNHFLIGLLVPTAAATALSTTPDTRAVPFPPEYLSQIDC